MTKLFFTIGFLLMGIASQSQDLSKHAIGLRLGNNNGLGYEVSYQHAMSDINRLQFDLGLRSQDSFNYYKLTGTYQWVWDLSTLAEGFNWFAGAGGGVGTYDSVGGNTTFVNIAGIIGIEYNFDFPLQVSLDTRPEFGIINGGNGLDLELALGARYKF